MITAVFSKVGNEIIGFSIKGHSGYAQAGQDIVCAAVSSAAYLTANLLERMGAELITSVEDGEMIVKVKNPTPETTLVLLNLSEQLKELKGQYPKYIRTAEIKIKAGGKK